MVAGRPGSGKMGDIMRLRIHDVSLHVAVLAGCLLFGSRAGAVEPDWKAVEQALGKPGQVQAGDVFRVAMPRTDLSVNVRGMDGAVWRDPERIHDWIGELSKSEPVVVFCAYGFHVGCKTAIALREAGFDAKYMKGGHSAWKAIGGPLKLYT
jgi:rhodanese-related sulfurtransferase